MRELRHQVGDEVSYSLYIGDESISLNELLGKPIQLTATGKKHCIHCGRGVKKLFHSGYCYPCFTTLAECDLCILKPHECHFHLGTCRDEAFADAHCMIPHYVYLAVSSNAKVGLTRKGRQLTRWVDQGASRATLLAELPTRKMAGELEMEIAKHMPDKTDWRKMLKQARGDESVNLDEIRQQVVDRLPDLYQPYILSNETTIYEFRYPRLPEAEITLKSHSFDKSDALSGVLIGIKGQYLLLDTGVVNIKKHSGYECTFGRLG